MNKEEFSEDDDLSFDLIDYTKEEEGNKKLFYISRR